MPKRIVLSRVALFRSLAELAVIVVGVLIALWADQWWAARTDVQTERSYLVALSDDISATVLTVEANLQSISRFRNAAAQLSSHSAEGTYPANEKLIDLLGLSLFEVDFFDHRLSSHQDLKNTGRLGLITDRNVRHSLSELDTMLEEIGARQSDLIGVQQNIVDPFLVRRTNLAAVAKSGYAATATQELSKAGYATADALIGDLVEFDHTDLMQDREFRGILAFRIVLLSELMESYIGLRSFLLKLHEHIESVLNE